MQTVTQCYREAIDAVDTGTYTQEKIAAWEQRLATVYNRGFWEGYYLGHPTGEWTKKPGSAATEKKIYVGKGSKYYPKIKVGEFNIESGSLKAGDTILITGRRHGAVKEQLHILTVNGEAAAVANRGDKLTLPVSTVVLPTDKLYKIVEEVNA